MADVLKAMDDSSPGRNGACDAERLGALFDRHAAALALFASQWCDCPEDVVQEALVELGRRGGGLDDPAAWLFRVVRNRAIDRGRALRRRRRHETAAGQQRAGWSPAVESDRLDAAAALAAVERLPEEEREIVVARIWGGLTFQQIAAMAGVSDSAAHRRYEKALASLREHLRLP
ncbi:MAG: sigma-70 family RNA polymerase sigma factor [Pirellulales bacterium]|nr:sigma-70 family RNA polymerase sigma factor [Pirellulales bacterium]